MIWGRKVKEEGSRVRLVHAVLKPVVIMVLTRMCLLLVRRYLNVSIDIPKIPWSSKSNKPPYLTAFSYHYFWRVATLISRGCYFWVTKTCTIHGPYEVTVTIAQQMWKHPQFLCGKTYSISRYYFWKNSKEPFDYGMGIHRWKEDFLKKEV